jgi:hypothetical protein
MEDNSLVVGLYGADILKIECIYKVPGERINCLPCPETILKESTSEGPGCGL